MSFILFIIAILTFLPLTVFLLYHWYLTEDLTFAKHLMLIWVSILVFIVFLTILIQITGNTNILFQEFPDNVIDLDY